MPGPAPVLYFDLGNTLKFGSGPSEQAYADAASTLQTLHSRGYRIGLLSNQQPSATVADVRQRLINMGLSNWIDTIVISSEITGNLGKPHQPIFDLALTKAGYSTGGTSYPDCVFITETLGHVEAARGFGWRAILKRNSGLCLAGEGECVEGLDPLTLLFAALPSDLWIADSPTHGGADEYSGSGWWSSPDLWIRNTDDNGTSHQSPEFGQDNYFYARVRNRGDSIVRSFTLGFTVKPWLGTQFVYPQDWVPYDVTVPGETLMPGESTVISALWEISSIPPVGTHACWLAVVMASQDPTPPGHHVWQHNNLAQKNLAIVDAVPGDVANVAIMVGSRYINRTQWRRLEVLRSGAAETMMLEFRHPQLSHLVAELPVLTPQPKAQIRLLRETPLELVRNGRMSIVAAAGSGMQVVKDKAPAEIRLRPHTSAVVEKESVKLHRSPVAAFGLKLPKAMEVRLMLRMRVPSSARRGETLTVDIVQRDEIGALQGGVRVEVRVR